MEELQSYLEAIPKQQLNSMLGSPAIREGFAADTAKELGISVEEILSYLETIIPSPEIKILEPKPKMKKTMSVHLWDLGESFKHRERKGVLMNQIYEVLESSDGGRTMTDILVKLRKNNGHWRPISKSIFDYMCARGDIVKIGSEIYLKKRNVYRESKFHREVFKQVLTCGPISTSAILNNLGYRNKRGYAKIRPILDMMVEEGFIRNEDRRWLINE